MSENMNNQETNKWLCVIAYIGILFFVPLVVDQNNQFYKFHANQALVLFLFAMIVNVAGALIPVLGWFLILPIGGIMAFVFMIMGMLNAFNEQMKPLPLIGTINLLK